MLSSHDFGHLRDRRDRVEAQPVAGVNHQASRARQPRTFAQAGQFGIAFSRCASDGRVAIRAGMQFHDGRVQRRRGFDLAGIRVDEQRNADPGLAQRGNDWREHGALSSHVKSALGGQLRALFGHEAARVRAVAQRDVAHFVGRRHFEIEREGNIGFQHEIVIADMAAILAQMRGDAVRAGVCRSTPRRAHRVRDARRTARVADGRDVVDVDAEA